MFKKFLSRRFLLTVGVFGLNAIGLDVPIEVIGVVSAFVLGESVTDACSALKRPNHRE